MTDETVTLRLADEPETAVAPPTYVLDEIDADLDEDHDLDLTAEPALSTDSLQQFLNEAGRYPLLTARKRSSRQADRARHGSFGGSMITSTCGFVLDRPALQTQASRSAI
jgi:hypothetical protein